MTSKFETLIVVADGGGACGFQEKQRHGPLVELEDWAEEAPESERKGHGTHGGTVVDRFGHGRSNVHQTSPADTAERKFLTKLAGRIDRAAAAHDFEKLILIAPPRALGVLRAALGGQAAGRLEADEPHDRMTETADQLRERLRGLRIPA